MALIMSPSVLMVAAGGACRRLWLVTRWRCARQDFMNRWWPRAHVHHVTAVATHVLLVKISIGILRAMIAMKVDRQDPQDRRALVLERGEQVGPHEDVVEVVVQHVEVVE